MSASVLLVNAGETAIYCLVFNLLGIFSQILVCERKSYLARHQLDPLCSMLNDIQQSD